MTMTTATGKQQLRRSLAAWLAELLPGAAEPEVGTLTRPQAGFSNETICFAATWRRDGCDMSNRFVVRMAPDPRSAALFPRYQPAREARCLDLVRTHTAVPVPDVIGVDPDGTWLGRPSIVTRFVDGRTPPDDPPYTWAGWVTELDGASQRQLEDATVEVIAGIHQITAAEHDLTFLGAVPAGCSPLRHHFNGQSDYYHWIRGAIRSPLVERAFARLEATFPSRERPAVLNWGDARIGNILYQGVVPAAVLDWEMAVAGPPELDLGWLVVCHRYFQHLAERCGSGGLPGLLERSRVAERYAELTGSAAADLDWFELYAALRLALVSIRLGSVASVRTGRPAPADLDRLIPHRTILADLLERSRGD